MDSIVEISFEFKHIVIILIILIVFVLIYKSYEKFSIDNESILNIESIYTNKNGNLYLNNVNVTELDVESFHGIIVAWSGTIETIPVGWALCDGTTNGTPDLRSQFILGASLRTDPSNSLINTLTPKYVNDVSGNEKVRLDVNNIPKHSHGIDWSQIGCKGSFCTIKNNTWVGYVFNTDKTPEDKDVTSYDNYGKPVVTNAYKSFSMYTNPGTMVPNTDVFGSDTPLHENMPPYYTLAYIMKI